MESRREDIHERVQTPRTPMSAPFDARETLGALAHPRLSTTRDFIRVAAEVRRRFEKAGYDGTELPFVFAPWVGRYALSAAGAVFVAGTVAAVVLLMSGLPASAALSLLIGTGGILLIGFGSRRMLHESRWGRRAGTNLLFRTGNARPRFILMAHLDTKSQMIPLSVRGPAIIVSILCWLILLIIAGMATAAPVPDGIVFVLGILAVLGGTSLMVSFAENESPGALDNASGVATLLGVAQRERDAGDVAFLVTDAEELGLAGARAAAANLPPVFGVINIDGIDDTGRFFVMERFGFPRRGLAPHLAAALLGAASTLQLPARRRDVPVGVLLDHMPIVTAGMPALTLMRGELRSLNRVHRPADDLTRLQGAGVTSAVDLLCEALVTARKQTQLPA